MARNSRSKSRRKRPSAGFFSWLTNASGFASLKLISKPRLRRPVLIGGVALIAVVLSVVVYGSYAATATASYNDNSPVFTYTGSWAKASAAKAYKGDVRRSSVANSAYTVSFTGTQAKLYTEKSPNSGIVGIAVDGGPEKMIDLYQRTWAQQQMLVFTTPTLKNGNHKLKVRLTGRKNAASGQYYAAADRVDVVRVVPTPTPVPTAAPTKTPTPAPSPTPAPTAGYYYVAPTGNDAANGQSATPWKTIQRAVNVAPSGAVIRVKAGTYAPFSVTRPGLTIAGAPGETAVVKGATAGRDVVTLAAANTTLTSMTVTGCVPGVALSAAGNAGVKVAASNVAVTNMKIADSHGKNAEGYAVGCYGIYTSGANSLTISGNNIYHNGAGITISGGGANTQITNNQVHDNDVVILNSNGDNDDYGAVGISFDSITVSPGPLAQGNTLYNNIGPSHDYVTDGGGFEIFKASNVRMIGNTIYNNDNIIETGTDGSTECVNNVFSGNTAYGKSAGSSIDRSVGMILRCNRGMQIANNTLGPVDSWMFDIETGGAYGSSVDGLSITGNKITMRGGNAVYAISVNPSGRGFNFNNNQLHYEGSFAWGWNNNTIGSLADWQKLSGLDKASTKF